MPFAHTFKPIQWQIKPWRSQSRTLLLHSGAGSGKSLLCAEKMHALSQAQAAAMGLVFLCLLGVADDDELNPPLSPTLPREGGGS